MNEDELAADYDRMIAEKNANPRTVRIEDLRKEFLENPVWAKTLFDAYYAERYYNRTGVNITALEWAHMRLKGMCLAVDRLRSYRKNARRSMKQMQAALERKNREIAELRNENAKLVLWREMCVDKESTSQERWREIHHYLRGKRG